MSSPTDLPLRAFICTGCGWLNRGVDGRHPGGHAIRHEGHAAHPLSAPCTGTWKTVLVTDEQAIDDLGTRFYRALAPIPQEPT